LPRLSGKTLGAHVKKTKATGPSSPSFERVFKHLLPQIDETAVVILKGHLIVEELLFDLLARRVFQDRAALSAAGLSFAKKLQLCRAWAPQPQIATFWELLVAINVLRNDLAHALDTPRRKQALSSIRDLYAKANPGSQTHTMFEPADVSSFLIAVFAFVSGVLLAIARPNEPPPSDEQLLKQLLAAHST
jgi:hypothetical protein